jgi:hypothetical protein
MYLRAMLRRELLTSTERLELLAFPDDEGELIRLYTLTKRDRAFIRQHEILDPHDGLIGSFVTRSKNRYERALALQGKAINDKVRL